MSSLRKVLTYLTVAAAALLGAVNYELFVFPNQFAPSGLNGICTMVQHITGFRVGYLSLIINVPLALLVYCKVSKPIALRSMVYVVTFSLGLVILDHVDLSAFAYSTDNGTSTILGPLAAGIIMGFIMAILSKAGAYSGGTDFVAALIHVKHPQQSVYGLIFILNAIVAAGSYFVYDFKMEPVILCIIYCFTSSTVVERAMRSGREAICFEIITEYPQEISRQIIAHLGHTTTLIPARGMYSGEEKNMLICVVNKVQVSALNQIIAHYPKTFGVVYPVSQVMGNFRDLNPRGKAVVDLLDHGDIH